MTTTGSLSVFGLGPKGLPQLTLEILEAMKTCDEIYANTQFQEELEGFCRELKIPVKPLNWGRLFACPHAAANPGSPPLKRISNRLLARLSKGGRVGLIVDGHPNLFCFATELIETCEAKGYRCATYASVSVLDQILVALAPFAGKMLQPGLAICSVLTPDLDEIRFDGGLGLLLYNMGHLLKGSPKKFEALASRLSGHFGGEYKVYIVECVPSGDNVRPCVLKDLVREIKLIGVNLTLFVPGRRA